MAHYVKWTLGWLFAGFGLLTVGMLPTAFFICFVNAIIWRLPCLFVPL